MPHIMGTTQGIGARAPSEVQWVERCSVPRLVARATLPRAPLSAPPSAEHAAPFTGTQGIRLAVTGPQGGVWPGAPWREGSLSQGPVARVRPPKALRSAPWLVPV